jgi:2-methylcitrate dehydratase
MPLLLEKFKVNLGRRFGEEQQRRILEASLDSARLDSTPVNDYVDLYVAPDPA